MHAKMMTGLISHRPFNAYTVAVNSCAHSLFVSRKHFHCNHLLLTAETFPKPIILCVCVFNLNPVSNCDIRNDNHRISLTGAAAGYPKGI